MAVHCGTIRHIAGLSNRDGPEANPRDTKAGTCKCAAAAAPGPHFQTTKVPNRIRARRIGECVNGADGQVLFSVQSMADRRSVAAHVYAHMGQVQKFVKGLSQAEWISQQVLYIGESLLAKIYLRRCVLTN